MMMVMFSFVGGAAAYRANVHIAVEMLTDAVGRAAGASTPAAASPTWRWSRRRSS